MENNLFAKIIEEKYDRFESNFVIDASDFLTPEEQSSVLRFVRSKASDGVFFFGGYAESERNLVLFMPEYTGISSSNSIDDILKYFSENPDDCPLGVLEIRIPPHEPSKPGHRDYLGSLMGEGIRREKIGDIIVYDGGAQIIAKKELLSYLCDHLTSVGRASVLTSVQPLSALKISEIKRESLSFNVASPRLDNVVSAVFGLSRKSAVEAISRGLVFISGAETTKPDYTLKDGDKIVLRGKGKAIYNGVTGLSKKGKSYIRVTKYI